MVVNRKYLCPAPHPTTWGERGKALLKSLGKDPKKRKQAIEQTLSLLAESHPVEKKKVGPGRKSNAEHALNFYNFVLELNESRNDELSKASPSKSRDSSIERPAKRQRKRNGRFEESSDDDNVDDEDQTTSSKVSSVSTADFLEQHNDLCEVCNLGGELLCCNTCNLVFHMECTRPILQKLPSGSWSCSYCVASGLTGNRKEAKSTKRAIVACRQMDRMREEKQKKLEDEKGGSHEQEKSTVESDEPAEKVKGEKNEETKPEVEQNTDEGKPATAASGEDKEKDDTSKDDAKEDEPETPMSPEALTDDASKRRARRDRRPPAIYDPQTCPASSWQSDGIIEWRYLEPLPSKTSGSEDSEEGESDSDEGSTKEQKQAEDNFDEKKKSSTGPAWCSFCKDDPSIPICCFCACRVCFGKHSGDKLLLCDKCDAEYHTFCLDPPLVSVPASKKWFCPSCKATKAKTEASLATRAAKQAVVKRPRGRPRKNPLPEPDSPTRWHVRGPDGKFAAKPSRGRKSSRAPATPRKKKASGNPLPARGRPPFKKYKKRGRPPKKRVHESKQEKDSRTKSASPSKRSSPVGASKSSDSKGTPGSSSRKSTKSGSIKSESRRGAMAMSSSSVSGRAVSHGNTLGSGNTKRQAGVDLVAKDFPARIPSPHAGKTMDAARAALGSSFVKDRSTFVQPPPLQRSRSGRPVKRNAFHDEVEEGEQHLRTLKGKASSVPFSQRKTLDVVSQEKNQAGLEPKGSSASRVPFSLPGNSVSSSQKQGIPLGPPVTANLNPAVAANPSTGSFKPGSFSTSSVMAERASTTLHSTSQVDAASTAVSDQTASATSTGSNTVAVEPTPTKMPRRKPGARECMQISRRFGVQPISQKYMDTLLDYCTRGKVEHLIRMRERLDDHSRFLESQLAGLEALVKEKGEIDITVPPASSAGKEHSSAVAQLP